jgi:hypothetical protein
VIRTGDGFNSIRRYNLVFLGDEVSPAHRPHEPGLPVGCTSLASYLMASKIANPTTAITATQIDAAVASKRPVSK